MILKWGQKMIWKPFILVITTTLISFLICHCIIFQFDNITYKDVIMLSISVIVSVTMFIVVNIENKMK